MNAVAHRTHIGRIGAVLGGVVSGYRAAERVGGPVADLAIRLWLAQVFLVSGILKLADWPTALHLARFEYPVTWLDPTIAAVLGVTVEIVGALLLAAGLATRATALALLALAAVIQLNYRALDVHLFWIALLAWFVVRGAGPLSLDRLLGGLAESALPFARPIASALDAITRVATPIYQFGVRVWIALAAFGFGMITGVPDVAPFAGAALPLFALIALGLATRVAALIAILVALAVLASGASGPIGYWVAALVLIALYGAGPLSLDRPIERALARRVPQFIGRPAFSLEGLPHVVVVGAGFGGLACARQLASVPVRVTIIDRHNYHLFQPLLYQVATTALSPGDIATPIRSLFRDQFNARVVLGTVTGVDAQARRVQLSDRSINYDYLVLATGAQHSYFGRDDWSTYAPGLKTVDHATEMRRRVLYAFERAELAQSDEERRAWLTFLIVGAGPTGVELAGAIAELARLGMAKEFRSFDPADAQVLLVQSGPRVLPTFAEQLSAISQASLERLGVQVLLNSKVEAIDEAGVRVNGQRIAARTVLWAAGVTASPAAKWLSAGGTSNADNAGRLKVGDDLSVAGRPEVFAIGDTAASNAWNGQPVPGLAPAAKQGGAYVASVIAARVLGRRAPTAFRYRHLGSLATIGRKAAVADFGFLRLRGAPAWWLWGLIHVGFLVGVRNRVSVMLDWFWSYLTFSGGTRLITGDIESAASPVSAERPRAASRERVVAV